LFAAHENQTRFEHPSCPLERVHNHVLKVIFHVPFGKHANKIRNRQYGLDVMREHTDSEFKNMMRLNRSTFNKLLEQITKYLGPKNELKARAAGGGVGTSISSRTKLYCTLRWLAGGNYHDISDLFGVSRGSFFVDSIYGIVWPTIRAIDRVLDLGFPINEMERLSAEFAQCSKGHMQGCVIAIDGWYCPTRAPFDNEVENITTYFNRHQGYGLVVLAGCDAKLKFNMFNVNNCGSTNDCLAYSMCYMRDVIENDINSDVFNHNIVPDSVPNASGSRPKTKYYYGVGDSAFTTTSNLLSPWPGRGIGPWKDSFNYHLSSMRQCIERAFGVLVRRWGILWRPLECSFNKWSILLTVCAKLHNLCVDMRCPPPSGRHPADHREGDRESVVMNGNFDDDDLQRGMPEGIQQRNTRKIITEYLQSQGVRRPLTAMGLRRDL
jgi:hypothetical protein